MLDDIASKQIPLAQNIQQLYEAGTIPQSIIPAIFAHQGLWFLYRHCTCSLTIQQIVDGIYLFFVVSLRNGHLTIDIVLVVSQHKEHASRGIVFSYMV